MAGRRIGSFGFARVSACGWGKETRLKSRDSIRLITGEGNEALERTDVKLVQTPQTFHSKILLPAYQIDYKDKFTDEATVVEAFGLKVKLVKGEENNFKITRPVDLVIAEHLLAVN